MLEFPPNRWFVVQVRPKAEKMVASLLRSKGYEDFLPLYWPSDGRTSNPNGRRQLPLFPGYVFCKSARPISSLVVTTPGVVRVLGIGGKPYPVDDIEIATLRAVQDAGFPARPWPKLEPGDLVTITDGPLQGCRGVLKRWKNRTQLLVSVELLHQSAVVTVPTREISVIRAQRTHETQLRQGSLAARSLQRAG
jgi:transcription termination/antitermination protein NusG